MGLFLAIGGCWGCLRAIVSGLEAASSSTNHPLPLFRSNAAHIAAQRLASAVTARIVAAGSPALPSDAPSPAGGSGLLNVASVLPASSPGSFCSASHGVSPSPAACSSDALSPQVVSHPVSPPLLNSGVSPGSASSS